MPNTDIPKNVDEYLKSFSGKQLALLEKVRKAIRSAAPKAEEVISYCMPAYKQNGILVYFAGFKNHCSFFVPSSPAMKKFAAELEPFDSSKGTIRFTVEHPLPLQLIKKIVGFRILENEEKAIAKKVGRTVIKKKTAAAAK